MPRLFSWLNAKSKTNRSEASDDISQVEIRNETQKEIFGSVDLQEEIKIHIGEYLELKDLNNFARTDSNNFKLFFNRDVKVLESSSIEYEKDETADFERIQKLIWKSLVFYYFPKFGENLNVKNYLHILRRRIQHVKLKKSQNSKIEIPTFSKFEDQEYVENCSWVYKCPLKYEALNLSFGVADKKFCQVCQKNVYHVDNMTNFKEHISKGNCVAYSPVPIDLSTMPMLVGSMAPPRPVVIRRNDFPIDLE